MKKATGKSNLSIVRDYLDGNRPFVQVGYSADSSLSERKDGEIWTDGSGKKWIKKNGVKKAINNVRSKIIDATKQTCKDCGMDIKWGNRHDHKFFNKTGRCYDCLIKFESHLMVKGLYQDYEKRKILSNQLSFSKDLKDKIEESITFLKTHKKIAFPNENGTSDEWTIEKREEIMKGLKKDLKKVNKGIENITIQLKNIRDVECVTGDLKKV